MNNLKKLNFLIFLIEIGEIYNQLYFKYDQISDVAEEYEHQNMTNYVYSFLIFYAYVKKRK